MNRRYAAGVLVLVIVVTTAIALLHRGFSRTVDTKAMNHQQENQNTEGIAMTLSSTAFDDGGIIPSRYTCDEGGLLSPPLSISGVPEQAKALALVMDDPDVPTHLKADGVFDHWILFNIPPDTTDIPEGRNVGTVGANSSGESEYTGPCPPPEYEPSEHRYRFALYALDAVLALPSGATRAEVVEAMHNHVVAQSVLTGRYKRQ